MVEDHLHQNELGNILVINADLFFTPTFSESKVWIGDESGRVSSDFFKCTVMLRPTGQWLWGLGSFPALSYYCWNEDASS